MFYIMGQLAPASVSTLYQLHDREIFRNKIWILLMPHRGSGCTPHSSLGHEGKHKGITGAKEGEKIPEEEHGRGICCNAMEQDFGITDDG